MDGVTAAVDHLAALDDAATGTRRQRLLQSLTAAGEHEHAVFARLQQGLRSVRGVTLLGTPSARVPVAAFTVRGYTPDQAADQLARLGVAVWTGPHGHTELIASFGADELGGAVLVGIMPHNTMAEVDALIGGLQRLVHGPNGATGANGMAAEARTLSGVS
jgi:selenocysteine lyase/cysteine desulfurase